MTVVFVEMITANNIDGFALSFYFFCLKPPTSSEALLKQAKAPSPTVEDPPLNL
jgi:hypothetical protein